MKNLEKLAELAKALPAPLKANALALVEKMGEVIEGIGDTPLEWRPGNLKVVQGTSDRSKLPKTAIIGSMVSGESVIPQPLEAIPLRLVTTRQYWNQDPTKSQMICQSPDGIVGFQYGECRKCPYQVFDTEAKKSFCNKAITVLIITADLSDILFVNFSKTNYSNGTDWQKLMKQAGVSSYKKGYLLSTETSKKSKNVEVLKAEPKQGSKIEGPVLAFVEEIYRITGEERTSQLASFYEYVKQRSSSNNALSGPESITNLISDRIHDDVEELQPVVIENDTSQVTTYQL